MRTLIITFLLTSLFVSPLWAQPQQGARSGEPVPGVVLVKFTPEGLPTLKSSIRPTDLPEAASKTMGNQAPLRQMLAFNEGRRVFTTFTPADTLARHRHTGRTVRLLDLSRWYTLTVPDTSRIEALVKRLENHPLIEAAAPQVPFYASVVTPDDPEFQNGDQWNLDNPTYDADIDAPEAWDLNKGRSDVTVAIIDSGIDYNHPDLDPGDRSRVIQGRDVAEDDNDPFPNYSGSNLPFNPNHGTWVAGIAGAITDNNQDVAGVMWNTRIMPVKISYTNGPWWDFGDWTQGSSFPTVLGEGVEYARNNGADVINLSLGRPNPPGTLERMFIGNPLGEAVYNAYLQCVVVVASSGNDNRDQVGFPAISSGVIAVGNTTITDSRFDDPSDGSNYGSNLDLVAPGTGYPSTKKGGGVSQSITGTSFSAPMVAGVAGLILSESRDRNLGLTNDDVQHLMEQTADNVEDMDGQDFTEKFGHGRVNARKALEALQPPNEVIQATHTGGSSRKIDDDFKQVLYDNGLSTGLASGTYIVDVYEVTGRVSFPTYFQNGPPLVWIRERSTKGWSAANPNDEMPWVEITNVTQSGFNYKTFVYDVESDINGRRIGWKPASPSNVEIAYTAVGEPGTPPLQVSLAGPREVTAVEQGTWTASVSGGEPGTPTYAWKVQEPGSFNWSSKSCSGSSCSHRFTKDTFDSHGSIRVTVTKASETDQTSTSVRITDSSIEPCDSSDPFCGFVKAPEMTLRAERSDEVNDAVTMEWTATGTAASNFEVQHRADSMATWTVIGRVSASESEAKEGGAYQFETSGLAPGTHQFRVGRVTAEGVRYAPAATVNIPLSEAVRLVTYPNPVRQRATVEVGVREAQSVDVFVYDVLGRRVKTLYSGELSAQQTRKLPLAPATAGLSSGMYFIRLVGETVTATRRLTVVR